MPIAHIRDLDDFMMNFYTRSTIRAIGFDRIYSTLFAEKPAILLDE